MVMDREALITALILVAYVFGTFGAIVCVGEDALMELFPFL
jgi:hypothetical protein